VAKLTAGLLQVAKRRVKETAPDWLGLLILTVMVLSFTQDIVVGGKVPFFRDLGTYFYPLRFILAQSLQAGELPLWDHRLAMGFPVFANPQAGVFYPPHLALVTFSFFSAIRFLFVFHYCIAAYGTFVLLRRWKYPVYLAIVGSVCFCFGGLVVSLGNLLDHFQSGVWLPSVLYCGERAFQRGTLNSILLLAVVSALQFVAGSPEICLMTWALLLADGLRMKSTDQTLTTGRMLRVIIGANLFAAGLAMVQLLPTFELYLQSWRSEGTSFARMAVWSLAPLRLLNLFFLDKEVNLQAFDGIELYFGREIPLLISLYSSVGVLCGFCFWICQSSRKEKIIMLGLIGISLLMSMGKYAAAYALVFQYFAFVPIRFPEKFLGLTLLFLLFAALTGFFRFAEERDQNARRRGLALFWGVVLATAGLYIFLYMDLADLAAFIARARHQPIHDGTTLKSSAAVMVQLERQLLLAIAVAVLFSLWKAGKIRGRLFQILLVGLVFFDLATAHRFYSLTLDPRVVDSARPILTPSMKDEGRFFYMIRSRDVHPNAYALNQKSFHDTISFAFAGLIPNTGVLHGMEYLQELDPLRRKPYEQFLRAADKFTPEQLLRLLGALHVKYVHSFEPLAEVGIKLVQFAPEYPIRLYEIENVIPKVYLTSGVVIEADPGRALARLSKASFNPRREVILEERIPTGGSEDLQGHAEISRYTNTAVQIRSKLTTPGVLVLADSYYPGWKLYVDGKESHLLRANLFFRGAFLEQGDHSIEFRFRPCSFFIGAFISVLTICGIVSRAIFVASKRRGF
jgi:hypothetical protein